MNEPILGKSSHTHGKANKLITWREFLKLREAAQKVADSMGYSVYLVGSALSNDYPRDIDISVIIPLDKYEEEYGKLPTMQDYYGSYLAYVINKTCAHHTELIDLQFCIDYWLDIKICPDTWWPEKPKMLLAEPTIMKG